MPTSLLPRSLRRNYEIYEWKHACAVLRGDYSEEWEEIVSVLARFRLSEEDIRSPGGGLSKISKWFNEQFFKLGWQKKSFDTMIKVDEHEYVTPTHEVDCFKNGIALEIEWSNKDPFFDRDLNNFRLLFDLRAISVGVIITKSDELSEIFQAMGKDIWDKYGWSTTWMKKLLPRIEGGGGGGCPILVFGITKRLYNTER